MTVQFTNFAETTLAENLGSAATTMRVAIGTGSEFPANVDAQNPMFIVLVNQAGNWEVVRCNGRAGDVFTIVRGAGARQWPVGTLVSLRPTAEAFEEMQRLARQVAVKPYAVRGGPAIALGDTDFADTVEDSVDKNDITYDANSRVLSLGAHDGTSTDITLPTPSEAAAGLAEKATDAELDAGTADKYPDAANVKRYVDANAGPSNPYNDGPLTRRVEGVERFEAAMRRTREIGSFHAPGGTASAAIRVVGITVPTTAQDAVLKVKLGSGAFHDIQLADLLAKPAVTTVTQLNSGNAVSFTEGGNTWFIAHDNAGGLWAAADSTAVAGTLGFSLDELVTEDFARKDSTALVPPARLGIGASGYLNRDGTYKDIDTSPVDPTPDASTTQKGKVELATAAETRTGTDAERAVTPQGMESRLDSGKLGDVQDAFSEGGWSDAAGPAASTPFISAALANEPTTATGVTFQIAHTRTIGTSQVPAWFIARVPRVVEDHGERQRLIRKTTEYNTADHDTFSVFDIDTAATIPGPDQRLYVYYKVRLAGMAFGETVNVQVQTKFRPNDAKLELRSTDLVDMPQATALTPDKDGASVRYDSDAGQYELAFEDPPIDTLPARFALGKHYDLQNTSAFQPWYEVNATAQGSNTPARADNVTGIAGNPAAGARWDLIRWSSGPTVASELRNQLLLRKPTGSTVTPLAVIIDGVQYTLNDRAGFPTDYIVAGYTIGNFNVGEHEVAIVTAPESPNLPNHVVYRPGQYSATDDHTLIARRFDANVPLYEEQTLLNGTVAGIAVVSSGTDVTSSLWVPTTELQLNGADVAGEVEVHGLITLQGSRVSPDTISFQSDRALTVAEFQVRRFVADLERLTAITPGTTGGSRIATLPVYHESTAAKLGELQIHEGPSFPAQTGGPKYLRLIGKWDGDAGSYGWSFQVHLDVRYIPARHYGLAGGSANASDVDVDTSVFDRNLSSADNTVQKALETLDDLVASGGGSVPDATTTVKGKVSFNQIDARIKPPARTGNTTKWGDTELPFATASRRGVAEIATNNEADTGSDNTKIMTPLQVKRRIDAIPAPSGGTQPDASETVKGIVELADKSESDAGTDNTRAMTPLRVKERFDALDAEDIAVAASGFDGNLATTDDNLQKVAQKLDDLVVSSGGGTETTTTLGDLYGYYMHPTTPLSIQFRKIDLDGATSAAFDESVGSPIPITGDVQTFDGMCYLDGTMYVSWDLPRTATPAFGVEIASVDLTTGAITQLGHVTGYQGAVRQGNYELFADNTNDRFLAMTYVSGADAATYAVDVYAIDPTTRVATRLHQNIVGTGFSGLESHVYLESTDSFYVVQANGQLKALNVATGAVTTVGTADTVLANFETLFDAGDKIGGLINTTRRFAEFDPSDGTWEYVSTRALDSAAVADAVFAYVRTESSAGTVSAADVSVDATGFDGNLATTDDNLQKVAQAFDDFVASGGAGRAPSIDASNLAANMDVSTTGPGTWTAWSDLLTMPAVPAADAGATILLGSIHGEVTTAPSGGGDRVYLEVRLRRTRMTAGATLEDSFVYIRNTGNANQGTTEQRNTVNEVSGKFGVPVGIADTAMTGDVYTLQARVLSQALDARAVRFDTETKFQVVHLGSGGGGSSAADVFTSEAGLDLSKTAYVTAALSEDASGITIADLGLAIGDARVLAGAEIDEVAVGSVAAVSMHAPVYGLDASGGVSRLVRFADDPTDGDDLNGSVVTTAADGGPLAGADTSRLQLTYYDGGLYVTLFSHAGNSSIWRVNLDASPVTFTLVATVPPFVAGGTNSGIAADDAGFILFGIFSDHRTYGLKRIQLPESGTVATLGGSISITGHPAAIRGTCAAIGNTVFFLGAASANGPYSVYSVPSSGGVATVRLALPSAFSSASVLSMVTRLSGTQLGVYNPQPASASASRLYVVTITGGIPGGVYTLTTPTASPYSGAILDAYTGVGVSTMAPPVGRKILLPGERKIQLRRPTGQARQLAVALASDDTGTDAVKLHRIRKR